MARSPASRVDGRKKQSTKTRRAHIQPERTTVDWQLAARHPFHILSSHFRNAIVHTLEETVFYMLLFD